MTDEWSTPRKLFDRLDQEFHFVLDAAATPENALCAFYFTRENDALQQDWHPYGRIWLNPPYDTPGRRVLIEWVSKAYSEAHKFCIVVCLLPAKTDTDWWHRYASKGQVRFIKGRLRYGGQEYPASFPSMVVVFSTWRLIVRHLLEKLKGRAHLKDLYLEAKKFAEYSSNNHVDEKIRQVLQRHDEFNWVGKGVWALECSNG